jgi:hypothetical protein
MARMSCGFALMEISDYLKIHYSTINKVTARAAPRKKVVFQDLSLALDGFEKG